MKGKYIVLIIDDNPDNFDVIEGFLYEYHYQLFYLPSGEDIIDQLNIINPDIILLDVMMPKINGIEVCREIKNNPQWRSIPIIMVTALTEKKDLALCLEMGANDFISKPFSSIELRARMKSLLRMKDQFDSLQDLLKLKEEMTNILVHDLRNPLTNILICAGMLKMPQLSPEKFLEKIEQIIYSGNILNDQINNLLQMAKIQSGKLLLSYELVNLNYFLKSKVDSFKNIANFQNIDLIIDLPEGVAKSFNIDTQIIGRVLDNLLSNALKFSPPNSQIICKLEYVNFNCIEIKVIDFGKTIPQDERELIFEKYEIGSNIKGVNQIGLGLFFCKMAINAHNGQIKVKPNQDRGNIFTITLHDLKS